MPGPLIYMGNSKTATALQDFVQA